MDLRIHVAVAMENVNVWKTLKEINAIFAKLGSLAFQIAKVSKLSLK